MKFFSNFFVVFCFAFLNACGGEKTPAPSSDASSGTVFDERLKAIEKAKIVEQQVLDAAQQQQAQIDAMSEVQALETRTNDETPSSAE